MTERETLKKWLDESSNIVFFGGGGGCPESPNSGFWSTNGVCNQKNDYIPGTDFRHTFFI